MRTRPLVIPAVLLLAACSAPAEDPAPAPEPVAEEEPTEAPTEDPTEDPTEEPSEETTAAECEAGTPETPLAEAITAADLPDGATVQLVQELEDIDTGDLDVIVYLCTPPLDEGEHRVAATDIAIAAHATGEGIDEMLVGQWTPEGEQGPVLEVEDFGMFTWDRDAARAPETVWEP